jgi:hypothetical protein
MKEVMLTPLFLDEADGDWIKAMRKAAKLFGPSQWHRAMDRVQREVGPLDPLVMTDGGDAYEHWAGAIVRLRGDIVHGRADADQSTAEVVVGYARQLVQQLNMRLIVGRRHPMYDQFMDLITEMQKALGTYRPGEPGKPTHE